MLIGHAACPAGEWAELLRRQIEVERQDSPLGRPAPGAAAIAGGKDSDALRAAFQKFPRRCIVGVPVGCAAARCAVTPGHSDASLCDLCPIDRF